MSIRRFAALLTLTAVAACTETTVPSPPAEQSSPNFLRWAAGTPQFSSVGAAEAFRPVLAAGQVGAPAVDRVTSSVVNGARYLSWEHTVGTGTNRAMFVTVSIRNGKNYVSRVSYRGQELVKLGERTNHDNAVRTEVWFLAAPASGSATVIVNLSNGAKAFASAVSLAGVDPASAVRTMFLNGSTDTGVGDPFVASPGYPSELIVTSLAAEGGAASVSPYQGLATQATGTTGGAGGEIFGALATGPGSGSMVAGFTKAGKAKWAIMAVVVKPYAPNSVSLAANQASFWARRGTARTLQINYAAGTGTSPFLRLTVSDPIWLEGRGAIAVGDSVLVTATVDPYTLAVDLTPNGLQVGTASQLTMWYSGAGGDLNGDGTVDASDSYIEQQLLGMWWQPDPLTPWSPIASTKNTQDKSFLTLLGHFSGYAICW